MYPGSWLPEPLVEDSADQGPEHEAVLADSVGMALLVVLESLTPAERLSFVLHDVFAVPFDDIARIMDRTPDSARQLASRARRRVQAAPQPDRDVALQRRVVDAFLAAARGGDFDHAGSAGPHRVLVVAITKDDRGFAGAFQVRDDGTASDRREVHGQSCAEVADAMAVVTAIALRADNAGDVAPVTPVTRCPQRLPRPRREATSRPGLNDWSATPGSFHPAARKCWSAREPSASIDGTPSGSLPARLRAWCRRCWFPATTCP